MLAKGEAGMTQFSELAGRLAQARRERRFLQFGSGTGFGSAAAAYQIQAQVAGLLGQGVAGWKVGIGPDDIAMAAPILDGDVIASGGTFDLSGDLKSVKVEAELALRLGRDLPPPSGALYKRQSILDAVAEIFCGIELVHTRFVNDAEVDFATRLADNFAHGAYVAGSSSQQFAGLDLSRLRCTVTRDGAIVSDRNGGHPLGDPLVPVIAWANAQCDQLGGLRAGQFITTGTLIDPFAVNAPTGLAAKVAGAGDASLVIQLT
jgi:2-keto-4-pentenoate hydratase